MPALMLLKLRHDSQEERGAGFSLRIFHAALFAQGFAPFWAHSRLMLRNGAAAVPD